MRCRVAVAADWIEVTRPEQPSGIGNRVTPFGRGSDGSGRSGETHQPRTPARGPVRPPDFRPSRRCMAQRPTDFHQIRTGYLAHFPTNWIRIPILTKYYPRIRNSFQSNSLTIPSWLGNARFKETFPMQFHFSPPRLKIRVRECLLPGRAGPIAVLILLGAFLAANLVAQCFQCQTYSCAGGSGAVVLYRCAHDVGSFTCCDGGCISGAFGYCESGFDCGPKCSYFDICRGAFVSVGYYCCTCCECSG
jgi:hypothetical protein